MTWSSSRHLSVSANKKASGELKLLDLYCGAGGAAEGYRLAGFDITGVDIEDQPSYPFKFVKSDAIEYVTEHGHEFDVIHSSPPCQHYSVLNAYNHKTYPDLIAPTRVALREAGKPYVIENVEGAKGDLIKPAKLCGPMFGLRVYRHRLFESSFLIPQCEHPKHYALCARNGYLPTESAPFMTITGGKHSKAWLHEACEVMGTPWMSTVREVCEAIPPAYTEYIGVALCNSLESAEDVAA